MTRTHGVQRERCPTCGAEGYTDGVCAAGSHQPEKLPVAVVLERRKAKRVAQRLRKKQRACEHGGWEFVAWRWNGNERMRAERCAKCRVERQVEA